MTNRRSSSREDKTRVSFASSNVNPENRCLFENIVTLDPQGTQMAWAALDVFTPAIELRDLTDRLHVALVKTIRESKSLKKAHVSKVHEVECLTLKSLRSAGL